MQPGDPSSIMRGERAWRPSKTPEGGGEGGGWRGEEGRWWGGGGDGGTRRDEGDFQDSLVVEESMIVKFPLVSFATCLLPLQLLLQGSFHKKKLNIHIGEIHNNLISWIMWGVLRHQMTYNSPPSFLQEQRNHYGKNFSRKSILFQTRFFVAFLT